MQVLWIDKCSIIVFRLDPVDWQSVSIRPVVGSEVITRVTFQFLSAKYISLGWTHSSQ